MSETIHTEAGAARIVLDASRRKAPISRRLFGKFTEHLGRNVYLGAWAQVVANGEFAPAARWGSAEALTSQLRRQQDQVGPKDLVKAPAAGLAPYWVARGRIEARIIEVAGRDVQRLTAGPRGGRIETVVFLPLARVRDYDLTLRARSDSPTRVRAVLRSGRRRSAKTVAALSAEWTTFTGRLAVPADHPATPGEPLVFAIELAAGAVVELDRALLFPADHLDGWDPEVVALLRAARLPLLRFPGGNFVSGYHWEDGVGPDGARPVLTNPAWGHCVEFNHVGTDEWLRLCELVGSEPMICVNAGSGAIDEARRWVEYCNGPADTPMGRRRAASGHPRPYGVRLWEIGNELYGKWQIGQVCAEGYAERYLAFTEAMRRADPDLVIIACGWDPAWNATLVRGAGAAVRSIAEHFLVGGRIGPEGEGDPRGVFEEFMAHADAFLDDLVKYYAPMVQAGLAPKIAVTEQMMFTHQPKLPGSDSLTEALWTAGLTAQAIRSDGLIEMITHSALVNHGGGLRKERGVVYANPVWWVTHLYGSQDGVVPTGVEVRCPTFSTPGKYLTKRENVPCLDVVALLNESGEAWSVFVVNRHADATIRADVEIRGFHAADDAEVVTVTGEGFLARNTLEAPEAVRPRLTRAPVAGAKMPHAFPPHSLTRITFRGPTARDRS